MIQPTNNNIMKLRSILCGMLAIAAAVACKPEDVVETPKLEVDQTAVSVAAEAGEATFNVTSNQDWTASADADWVTVTPNNAKAAEKAVAVKVTAEDNDAEAARTATVTVKAGELSKTVKVTQAGKTADPAPEPEPEPELKVSDWAVVGSFTGEGWGWDAAAGIPLYILNDEYFVLYGQELPEGAQFKFLQGGAWGGAEVGADRTSVEPNTIQQKGGTNICLTAGGTYDLYLAADASKYYIMSPGKTPAEATEPAPAEVTYTVTGTLQDNNWNNMAAAGLMTKEGNYYVAKNVPFVTAATLYGGADQLEFKICNTGSWDGAYGASAEGIYGANAEIAVAVNGGNIAISAPEGAYDVYFDKENGKTWVMTPGYKPGDEVPGGNEPQPEYSIDGRQWLLDMDGSYLLLDLGLYEEGAMVIALELVDGSGFGAFMYGTYEIEKTDATSGKVIFTQYDPEWDEWMEPVDYPYSDLTETSVNVVAVPLVGDTTPITFTAVDEPYDITFEAAGEPSGEIEDGEYWFIEPTTQKVMTPLGETQTYGRPAADDAIGGASTEKNAFTFNYNPDWSCYTIQDSYGRYLYSSMQADGVTPYRTLSVADTTPADDDENLAYYMWTVYNNGDGTYDVYNCATYYSISYSASYNNWEIYDPYEDDFNNLFAALVKADNPVAEPQPEPEPEQPSDVKTLTNAEICAAMTSTGTSYVDYTIESASGLWTVNASQLNTNTFLQCRGRKGSYIKTPEFDKDIKSVTLHFSAEKSVYANNTYCAFPATWTAPTEDAAYPEDGNVGKAVTDGSYSVTIPVNAGNKQVCLALIGTYSYYLDHIDVAF